MKGSVQFIISSSKIILSSWGFLQIQDSNTFSGKYVALRPGGCYADHESKQSMFPLDDEGMLTFSTRIRLRDTRLKTIWHLAQPWAWGHLFFNRHSWKARFLATLPLNWFSSQFWFVFSLKKSYMGPNTLNTFNPLEADNEQKLRRLKISTLINIGIINMFSIIKLSIVTYSF